MIVNEPLHVAFGPLGLVRYGEVNVGHVCSLQQGVTAVRAVFGDDDDSAKAECAVGRKLHGMRLDRGGPLLVYAVGMVSVIDEDDDNEREDDQ